MAAPAIAPAYVGPQGVLSSKEFLERSLVSHRMLQWWTEHGILDVPIVGHSRRITLQEAVVACCVLRLTKASIPMKDIRSILPSLRAVLRNRNIFDPGAPQPLYFLFEFDRRKRRRWGPITTGRLKLTATGKEEIVAQTAKASEFGVILADVAVMARQFSDVTTKGTIQ